MAKLFIVRMLSDDGYDVWDVSFHRTRKGALKYIIDRNYQNWLTCRYINPESYDNLCMYIREEELLN